MSTTRWCRMLAAVVLLTVACTEQPPTQPSIDPPQTVGDLDLVWPTLTAQARTPSELVELQGTSGPAAAFDDGGTGSDPTPEWPPSAASQIYSASTEVGFTSSYAYSRGRQVYSGNVGSVTTTATVSFEGQVIGTQPAERQDYTPYLLDFGEIKTLTAEAYVFVDQDCGLRVNGASHHSAWWQWFLGGPAPQWGAANMSSQAFPPADQPPCVEMEEPFGPGNYPTDAGSDGNGPVACWYWVTYDPYTGEILDAEFLYCESMDGG